MLQTIREYTQGWIAGVIITIIILTFALWGIHSYFVGGTSKNDSVAQVNGIGITKEQLSTAYERLRRQIQTQFGMNNPLAKNDAFIKERALQGLIELEALKQSAYDEGFRISNEQVDNYLQNMREFQVEGQFSLQRFQEVLTSVMMSSGEFLNLIQTSLLVEQPKLGIIYSAYSLPNETQFAMSLVSQEREIAYLDIPLSYFSNEKIVIPPSQIKQYYQDHQNEFVTPEQVSIEYVQLSSKDLMNEIKPSESELKSFFDENINSFVLPKQWKIIGIELPFLTTDQEKLTLTQAKLKNILSQIKSQDDFLKFANLYPSHLPTEWMLINQIPNEFKKIIPLMHLNEISKPISTHKGLMVIKIVDMKMPQKPSFNEVKDKVIAAYQHQHAEEKLAEQREQLANLSYEHPESIQAVASPFNLPILTSGLFSKEKVGAGIAQYKKVREIAFSNEVLNLKNNSDVIQINPETIVVIRLKSHLPAAHFSIGEVSKQIEEKLKRKEIEIKAENLIQAIKTKLIEGIDPQQLALSYKLNWHNPGYISRYTNFIDSAILDMAFRLPHPSRQQNKIQYNVAHTPDGYAIIALKAVRESTVDKKQFSVFREQLERGEGELEYELYKRSQINKAKIKA